MERTWLIELRQQVGYSQVDIAEKLNTSQQTISRWELGIRTPKPKQAKRLAEVLGYEDWTRVYE
jgi:transcriptional regulator with XRE-family HTH domain